MDFEHVLEFEKIEPEQRIAWGWAYVCEEDGHQVIDHSGDIMDAADVQKAAHGFVCDSRTGRLMHEGEPIGHVVDSIFFSKALQEALGIHLGKVGWFLGIRVDDDAAWAGIKDGTYPALSIGGSADAVALDKAFNEDQPRDERGRWGSGGGGGDDSRGGGGSGSDADDDEQTAEADRSMVSALRRLDAAHRSGKPDRVRSARRLVSALHSEISPRLREQYSERFRREGIGALGRRRRPE